MILVDADNEDQISELVSHLERRHLERHQSVPPVSVVFDLLSLDFIKIEGLSRFWEKEEIEFDLYMEDILAGAYGQRMTVVYILFVDDANLNIYLGMNKEDTRSLDIIKESLGASYPFIKAHKLVDVKEKAWLLNYLRKPAYCGMLTGIPTRKSTVDEQHKNRVEQIERIIRGIYMGSWAYIIIARPAQTEQTDLLFERVLDEVKAVSGLTKKTVTETHTVTAEHIDRPVQYYVDILERTIERLRDGRACGLWEVAGYFMSDDLTCFSKLKAIVRSVYSGKDSFPEPFRVIDCSWEEQLDQLSPSQVPVTLLNSSELATLVQIPREEFPGYMVTQYAKFDVCVEPRSGEQDLVLGEIMDRGVHSGKYLRFRVNDLCKHTLMTGVTGSGKTNTIFCLLDSLWKHQELPFLVIEPAKSEYRELLNSEQFGSLRVYTLGDEKTVPFRLNPFEPVEGTRVQTHLDYLKSAFLAAFMLYPPMPYVLERCIYEVYKDRGWNLRTDTNLRASTSTTERSLLFPTMSDLYEKIDPVVDGLGYELRLQMDIKAALKARIGSLMVGGKGHMLNTQRSIDMPYLLSVPTVLELKRIGDDEEKTFVIGLVMVRLYEYLESIGPQAGTQHLTVIEEAHRLLRNVPMDTGNLETANMRGKAVEVFSNMLSEIRAYGEGLIVSEQIPTKLAPDVIKNTNLKMLHRVVAQDDRDIVGTSMNLEDDQSRFVVALSPGDAVVHAEGMDTPFLIKVFDYKGMILEDKPVIEDDELSRRLAHVRKHIAYRAFISCDIACPDGCEPELCDLAADTAGSLRIRLAFSRCFLSALSDDIDLNIAVESLMNEVESVEPRAFTPKDNRRFLFCLWLHLSHFHCERRGLQYGWMLSDMHEMKQKLEEIGLYAVDNYLQGSLLTAIPDTPIHGTIQSLRKAYQDACTRYIGPFSGCQYCDQKCLLQFDVLQVIDDPWIDSRFRSALDETGDEMWHKMAAASLSAAGRLISGKHTQLRCGLAVCYAVQKASEIITENAIQLKISRNVKAALEDREEA